MLDINIEEYNLSGKNILRNINLQVKDGHHLFVKGPNGSGKTSLLLIIAGAIKNFQGSIDFYKGDDKAVPRVGLLLQNPEDQIMGTNIIDSLVWNLQSLNIPKKEMDKRLLDIVELFEFKEIYQKIKNLSRGEKQKVAFASVLVMNPNILIIDESFETMDYKTTIKISKYLDNYVRSTYSIIISSIHSIDETFIFETNKNILELP